MLIAVGALAFFVALLVSVTLHEAGHFLTARRYGMKATQFFVGFGPTVWSRRRGETEYGIKAIPAGGFVKIVGMTPLEELEPGDEDRAFYRQPARRKTVVLAAGSTMHFVIAVLLVFAAAWGIGQPSFDADRPAVLSAPQECIPKVITVDSERLADPCDPAETLPGPAYAAGLRGGDHVLSVDGAAVSTYREFVTAIRSHVGTPAALVVERDGEQVSLTVTPAEVFRPSLADDRDNVVAGAIGVGARVVTERVGFTDAIDQTGATLQDMVVGTYQALTTKLASVKDVYSSERDVAGVVGVVGVGRISGEVASADEEVSYKVWQFLLIVAGLNLFVGVFNLLPLLPLDGGHIAVVFFEQVRDKLRRLRGYAGELQRVDYNKLLPLTYGVAMLFVVFTVFVAGADIVNPITLEQ